MGREPPASRARSVRHGARGGPGTSPLPPLLLLLLGAGFLLVSFRALEGSPRPVQGGLGPPEPRKRLLAQSPKPRMRATGRLRRLHTRIPRRKGCPSKGAGPEPGEERVNLLNHSRIGVGLGRCCFRSWTELQLEWREVRPTPFIHSAPISASCRLHRRPPPP